jgi:hypothetical protein
LSNDTGSVRVASGQVVVEGVEPSSDRGSSEPEDEPLAERLDQILRRLIALEDRLRA